MTGLGSTGLPSWFNIWNVGPGLSDPMLGQAAGMQNLQNAEAALASMYQEYLQRQATSVLLSSSVNELFGPSSAQYTHPSPLRGSICELREPKDIPDWVTLTPAQWLGLAVLVAFLGFGYACFVWGL